MMLIKALTGWRLYLILGTAALSAGFYGGIRWEKGAQYTAAQRALEELSIKAQEALVTLGDAWEEEAAQAQFEINEWKLQNERDQELLFRLLAGQSDIRTRFNELDNEITVDTNFGTCQLSPDAVRLLREASARTSTTELPVD
jgi:predicted nuclease with TOPRIM domain